MLTLGLLLLCGPGSVSAPISLAVTRPGVGGVNESTATRGTAESPVLTLGGILFQSNSALAREVVTEDSPGDHNDLYNLGCPWLHDATRPKCPPHSNCKRTLRCELSRRARFAAWALPAGSLFLAALVVAPGPRDLQACRPINWQLNRLPCCLTPVAQWWFNTEVFPPTVGSSSAPAVPELTVALYLVGLLGWLLLASSGQYLRATPLDTPEYLGRLVTACRHASAACTHGSLPAEAGFQVITSAIGSRQLKMPYPTSLLYAGSPLPLDGNPAAKAVATLIAVRTATLAGMLSTIFALPLSRLCSGSAVTALRAIAAVGSAIFCVGFAVLEAMVRWRCHLWVAPAWANVGIAIFCAFLLLGVDARHFLTRWAFYCALVPLYFTAGTSELKAELKHGLFPLDDACAQMRGWLRSNAHRDAPLRWLARFATSDDEICLSLQLSALALELGLVTAETLPWLARPLLPLLSVALYTGVWLTSYVFLGGHLWVWCLCTDVLQLPLRPLVLVRPYVLAAALRSGLAQGADDSGPDTLPHYGACCGDSEEAGDKWAGMRPKAAAAAAACTILSLAIAARGCVSAWVSLGDSDQWPFTLRVG